LTLRRRVNAFLAVFSAVVVTSFAFGAYLVTRFGAHVAPPAESATESVEPLIAQAADHLASKQTEQALFWYRRALSIDPRSLPAQIGVARGELMAGREDEASREYERALILDPANSTVLLEVARLYSHRAASWDQAEARFAQYVSLQPLDADAQLDFARILAWRGKALEATRMFERPTVSKIMTVGDRKDYAFALIKSGQTSQAETVLDQLVSDGHQDFHVRTGLADIYAARRDWNAALPMYRSLLQESPDDPRVNLTYGLGLLSIRSYREAIVALRKARKAMPTNGEARLGYARALKAVGDRNGAADEFERALPLYRGNAAITREYADLLLEKKDYSKSERVYKRALSLGLRDARLFVGLSGALRGNRKPREALQYLEAAYRLEPTDRLAFELARLLQQLGRSGQALAIVNTIDRSSVRSTKGALPYD
jgi:tetratricopeptide (TPR) repeat protein